MRVGGKFLAAELSVGRERVTFPCWMAALPSKYFSSSSLK